MSYQERQRLADIQAAIDVIRSHLQRGDLSDGLIFHAVRIRLPVLEQAIRTRSRIQPHRTGLDPEPHLPSSGPFSVVVAGPGFEPG